MSSTQPVPPPPPGLSSRRSGNKAPPKLPLSIFTKASSASPLSADPSSVFPNAVVDANVAMTLDEWRKSSGDLLKKPISGIVLVLGAGASQPVDEKSYKEMYVLVAFPVTDISFVPLVSCFDPLL